jgi:tRNA dimethylallyltransferase
LAQSHENHSRPLLALVGPTGSGKTSLSLALAKLHGAEIISCDSVAVYRHFEIGTAKPSREERGSVRHHLIDVVEPAQPYTAGDYSRDARLAAAGIGASGKLPIVVGGTGLYLRALLEGLFPGPPRSEELRERLRSLGEKAGHLHQMLRRLDAGAAARIHANDQPKLIRALEVCFTSRRTMSDMHAAGRDPLQGFRILRIGLDPDRDALYLRINQRCEKMFSSGLVEETRTLLERYGDALLKSPSSPLNALGYKQAVQHIQGELSLAEAIKAAQQAHRNYAKRQMTWFRREPSVHWLRGFGDEASIRERAAQLLSEHLRPQ